MPTILYYGDYGDGVRHHGFLLSGGSFTTIDFPGDYYTYAYGINDAGQIVGVYYDASGGHGFIATPIEENQPPVAKCKDITVVAGSYCTAIASIDNGSYDPDGSEITLTQDPAGPYGLGTTLVTLTVSDDEGATSQCTGTVTVVDNTPPTITNISASPSVLWPPNHKMVPVTVSVSAYDNCDPNPYCKITSVSSNEPENGICDGDTAPDWEITGDLTVNLRAERSGKGDGRIYTITITCTDDSGNSSTGTVNVTVPHDQKKQKK